MKDAMNMLAAIVARFVMAEAPKECIPDCPFCPFCAVAQNSIP
jgi:hypothetical protein